ncbi:hypothetical protein ZEAMMB73_Zm00001d006698 [Zea mays]|uniref:Uncharacterized protein n=1 Tax=Zea mays TaxID=4577 RepID=A0A1D6EZN5_MAIZE|nr:hypothetical protein ZEAMMB73_Zm00001d006698 [Zea mays]
MLQSKSLDRDSCLWWVISFLYKDLSHIFYCPLTECFALLVDDPEHEFKFQRPRKDEQGREDLLPRKVEQESKWQRCGHCFYYLCASPMSRDNRCCKTCNRTWGMP